MSITPQRPNRQGDLEREPCFHFTSKHYPARPETPLELSTLVGGEKTDYGVRWCSAK
jgi:hypothetical protein